MVQILAEPGSASHEEGVRTHNGEAAKPIHNHTKTSSVTENKRKKWLAIFLLGIGGMLSSSAMAETLLGRVVGVSDGDTITVLDASNAQHKIRLSGIDAPEKAQPFGQRAKESLSRLVFQKEVEVAWNKRDRYGRILGKVRVQPPDCRTCPKTLDAGQAQLSVGMAWWYRKYAMEQSPADRGTYEFEEREARARRAGLWQDPDPIAPWDWRHPKK